MREINIHALCWLVYICYEVLVSGILSGNFSHFYYYFFFYILNISLFYSHALYIMPNSFRKTPYTLWKLPFLFLLQMGLYILATIVISQLLEVLHARRSPLVINKRFITGTVWRGALFILFSTGYYFLVSYFYKRKQEMQNELEVQKLKLSLVSMEMDFVRSQINPHLLFNTLNFIKYASKHDPQQSDEAIIRLSEIMSFAIEKSMDGLILLTDELKQIENIIRLNQLRFGNKLHIQFKFTIDDEKVKVLPIILLTLIENIFKHGNLHQASKPATIIITCSDNQLEFWTGNLPNANTFAKSTSGLGIPNIIFRLKNTYGDRFIFNYGNEGDFYKTYLRIPL